VPNAIVIAPCRTVPTVVPKPESSPRFHGEAAWTVGYAAGLRPGEVKADNIIVAKRPTSVCTATVTGRPALLTVSRPASAPLVWTDNDIMCVVTT
jgi:hypothetical protein